MGRHQRVVCLGRLEDAGVDVGGDGCAVGVFGRDDIRVGRNGQVRIGECGRVGQHAGHLDDVDTGVVAVLGDQPHRVAGDRVMHGRGAEAEVVQVVLEDRRGGRGGAQVRGVDRDDLGVPAAGHAEHVEREHERVVVVAEVSGEVGVEAALGGRDRIELPVGRAKRGGSAGRGHSDVEAADMRVEVDILVTDDESADLLVVGDDGVGQARRAVGTRQPAGREQETAQGRRDGRAVGRLGGEQADGLVDGLDVRGRSGGTGGVGRNVSAAVVEIDAGVVVEDADRQ